MALAPPPPHGGAWRLINEADELDEIQDGMRFKAAAPVENEEIAINDDV